jgi:hypothetical protein
MKVQAVWIEAMWHIAAFLTSAILCAKGYNQISNFFDLPPPTLEQFLDNTMNAYINMQINDRNNKLEVLLYHKLLSIVKMSII